MHEPRLTNTRVGAISKASTAAKANSLFSVEAGTILKGETVKIYTQTGPCKSKIPMTSEQPFELFRKARKREVDVGSVYKGFLNFCWYFKKIKLWNLQLKLIHFHRAGLCVAGRNIKFVLSKQSV